MMGRALLVLALLLTGAACRATRGPLAPPRPAPISSLARTIATAADELPASTYAMATLDLGAPIHALPLVQTSGWLRTLLPRMLPDLRAMSTRRLGLDLLDTQRATLAFFRAQGSADEGFVILFEAVGEPIGQATTVDWQPAWRVGDFVLTRVGRHWAASLPAPLAAFMRQRRAGRLSDGDAAFTRWATAHAQGFLQVAFDTSRGDRPLAFPGPLADARWLAAGLAAEGVRLAVMAPADGQAELLRSLRATLREGAAIVADARAQMVTKRPIVGALAHAFVQAALNSVVITDVDGTAVLTLGLRRPRLGRIGSAPAAIDRVATNDEFAVAQLHLPGGWLSALLDYTDVFAAGVARQTLARDLRAAFAGVVTGDEHTAIASFTNGPDLETMVLPLLSLHGAGVPAARLHRGLEVRPQPWGSALGTATALDAAQATRPPHLHPRMAQPAPALTRFAVDVTRGPAILQTLFAPVARTLYVEIGPTAMVVEIDAVPGRAADVATWLREGLAEARADTLAGYAGRAGSDALAELRAIHGFHADAYMGEVTSVTIDGDRVLLRVAPALTELDHVVALAGLVALIYWNLPA